MFWVCSRYFFVLSSTSSVCLVSFPPASVILLTAETREDSDLNPWDQTSAFDPVSYHISINWHKQQSLTGYHRARLLIPFLLHYLHLPWSIIHSKMFILVLVRSSSLTLRSKRFTLSVQRHQLLAETTLLEVKTEMLRLVEKHKLFDFTVCALNVIHL